MTGRRGHDHARGVGGEPVPSRRHPHNAVRLREGIGHRSRITRVRAPLTSATGSPPATRRARW